MRLTLLTLLVAVPAFAGGLFINGVNVDGLTNQSFDKVNVRIDEKGNVLIDAPGYSVKKLGGASNPEPEATGQLTKHYILVTEQQPSGMTEFDIDLFINGKHIRTMRNGEDQIVADVTKYLRPGKNAIQFQAKKNFSTKGEPRSVSKSHVFRVIIGEGEMGSDQVLIENPVVKFERTAADMSDTVQDFTLTTR
jgi:hypothetical protein